jgi:hypothetical protein
MTDYRVGCITGNSEKHEKMRAIYDSCMDLGIDPPDEVAQYFDSDCVLSRIEGTVDFNLPDYSVEQIWGKDGNKAWIVDLSKLDEDVKKIVFYVGW